MLFVCHLMLRRNGPRRDRLISPSNARTQSAPLSFLASPARARGDHTQDHRREPLGQGIASDCVRTRKNLSTGIIATMPSPTGPPCAISMIALTRVSTSDAWAKISILRCSVVSNASSARTSLSSSALTRKVLCVEHYRLGFFPHQTPFHKHGDTVTPFQVRFQQARGIGAGRCPKVRLEGLSGYRALNRTPGQRGDKLNQLPVRG